MSAALVSIIGPPASGKTTLAEGLARELPAELIREDYEGNPFLADSYLGGSEARLPAQLHYLLSRVEQLSRLTWPDAGVRVSDYGFCHDRIFARTRLSEGDYAVYAPVADALEHLVHPPDVLVLLDAAEATLLERIRHRGRGFETVMTPAFLAAIRSGCAEVARAAACAVVAVDCDAVDFRQAGAMAEVVSRVRERIPASRK